MARLLNWRARVGRAVPGLVADERGVGVPTAVFVSSIVFLLGATWAQIGVHDVQLSSYERCREQTLNAAEAGINAAMSELTIDSAYAGGTGTLAAKTGEYDIEVTPINTGDPDDLRRQIVATGYAPSRTSPNPCVRRLEAEVDLETTDGFDFALFAGAGTVTGDNHLTVNGDLYSTDGITLYNNSDVQGDVVSPKFVTTNNNSLIAGDVRAGENVTLNNSATTVQGSVFAGGACAVNAHVVGNVQAGGSISVGSSGRVDGSLAPNSPPPPVRVETLPTFTWNSSNYSPTPSTWSSTTAFYTDWSAKALTGIPFNGHHRITSSLPMSFDVKWKMDADVTIVSDGKISLNKEVTNAGSDTLNLVIISTSEEGIEMSGNVTIADSIHVLLFAPNGPVVFRNLKHFTGAVYGESVDVDQNFTLTWARPEAPGFSWTTSTDVHHRVIVRVLREMVVPAT
ncbi:MAG: hypothetical protein HYU28_09160 [Actinobacteria bacterium]|nr:hypothetical protein [Actinomycetota bacterium]